jgi:hypothetical protein
MLKRNRSWVLVAHTCNPSYPGGRDQEKLQFEASLGKEFERHYLEKSHHKKGLVEWLKVQALSSRTSTTKKKKRERERETETDGRVVVVGGTDNRKYQGNQVKERGKVHKVFMPSAGFVFLFFFKASICFSRLHISRRTHEDLRL